MNESRHNILALVGKANKDTETVDKRIERRTGMGNDETVSL
jgi:hypothetical protein